jgi:superfamily I DNA/RNA helicase
VGDTGAPYSRISLEMTQSEAFNWHSDFRTMQLDSERVQRMAIFTKGYVKRLAIHQSKGFEFPFVFLMGLTQDAFADSEFIRSFANYEDVTRALLYVAMTRARDKLYMSAPGPLHFFPTLSAEPAPISFSICSRSIS